MKRIITLCAAILMSASIFAQAPNKMSYQAVIRNSSNALVNNQSVGMRISILQGSVSGLSVYVETQVPTTNINGLASIEIGGGIVVSGNFTTIDWTNGPYFIKTETDPTGGTNYIISGTSQLLSVPYALFSGNGILGVSSTGDSLLLGNGTAIIIPGISGVNNIGGQTGITQHTCGATNVHNPSKAYGTMTDQEGNVYKTIVIGTQEWMAENLKTAIYRNGNLIPEFPDNQWQNLTIGSLSSYNFESQYDCPYGKLYNWYAVTDSRKLCPAGWHIPTDDEWSVLINYLDPNAEGGINLPNIAGAKLKSAGNQYWEAPNQDATNESGFSALPAGLRDVNGQFQVNGKYAIWWSSSENDSVTAWCRFLLWTDGTVYRQEPGLKQPGYSVRCIKD
jgi:uncharacterized protein (TIGR02145 family)